MLSSSLWPIFMDEKITYRNLKYKNPKMYYEQNVWVHEKVKKEILILDVILLFDNDIRKIIFTCNAVDSNKNQYRILLVHRFENVDVTN